VCRSIDLCAADALPFHASGGDDLPRVSARMKRGSRSASIWKRETRRPASRSASSPRAMVWSRIRNRHHPFVGGRLRRAFQRDGRQVLCPALEVDLECESIAGLAGDKRTWAGTGRVSWPAFAWLDAWSSVGRSQSEVDFVGGRARERRARAIRVVPGEVERECPTKVFSALRNQDVPRALVFHGLDEAFDHGDASVLPHSAISRADSFTATPALEVRAPEDAVLVADQVFGYRASPSDHPPKKAANRERLRPLRKDGKAHCTSRVVVNDHGQPPAEWPALRQRERRPRCPEACARGHGGQVDVPDVVGALGSHDAVVGCGCLRWRRAWRFFEDPSDRRCTEVQARTAQHLGDLGLAQAWAQCL